MANRTTYGKIYIDKNMRCTAMTMRKNADKTTNNPVMPGCWLLCLLILNKLSDNC